MCSTTHAPIQLTPLQPRHAVLTIPAEYHPKVNLASVRADRDFAFTLQQTKLVYDQMLEAKYGRLMKPWYVKKVEFEQQCCQFEDRGAIDEALKYGVRAQEYLNRQHADIVANVCAQQQDYQHKLDSMYTQLEDNWRKRGKVAKKVIF